MGLLGTEPSLGCPSYPHNQDPACWGDALQRETARVSPVCVSGGGDGGAVRGYGVNGIHLWLRSSCFTSHSLCPLEPLLPRLGSDPGL